jgi:hypothetical protein
MPGTKLPASTMLLLELLHKHGNVASRGDNTFWPVTKHIAVRGGSVSLNAICGILGEAELIEVEMSPGRTEVRRLRLQLKGLALLQTTGHTCDASCQPLVGD